MRGLSVPRGWRHRLGAPPECWGGARLLICHLLKVIGKDMDSVTGGVPVSDKKASLPQPQVLVSLGTAGPHPQLRPVLPAAAQAGWVACWPGGPPLAPINAWQLGKSGALTLQQRGDYSSALPK